MTVLDALSSSFVADVLLGQVNGYIRKLDFYGLGGLLRYISANSGAYHGRDVLTNFTGVLTRHKRTTRSIYLSSGIDTR